MRILYSMDWHEVVISEDYEDEPEKSCLLSSCKIV